MSAASGSYCNGERLASVPVRCEVNGGMLRVVSDAEMRELPWSQVRVSDRLGRTARFLYLPDRSVIETLDNDAVDGWLGADRRGRMAAWIHALESHSSIAAVACALLLVMTAVGLYLGPPKLARAIAARVPPATEQRAGEVALASIDRYFAASTLTARERQRVEDQLMRVLGSQAARARPRLVFRSMPGAPNAFALPGGIIVVADQLVRLPATDEELAAALAHEVGHLERRHGIQTVLRQSFALLFVSGITGDLSVLTSFAAALPLTIVTNGYSRDLEREADAVALATLKARGVPPRSFSTLLFKLNVAVAGATGQRATATYLSTHPADEERMEQFGVLTDREKQTLTLAVRAGPKASDGVFTMGAPVTAALAVDKVDVKPFATIRTPPDYPMEARKKGVEGKVIVDFVVTTDGSVANAFVYESSNAQLDFAALVAVQSWRFLPGRKGNQPVNTHMQVPIIFKLRDEPRISPATAAAPPPK